MTVTCNEPNPFTLTNIPSNTDIHFAAQARASYYQKVTITLNGTTVEFSGSGEGTKMTTSTGAATATISSGTATSATLHFQHSSGGANGQFVNSNVCPPSRVSTSPIGLVTISSEDSVDNDDNDTYLSAYWLA